MVGVDLSKVIILIMPLGNAENICILLTVNSSFKITCRCSRQHPRPTSSVTLMIPAMYNDIRLSQSMLDEADQDTSLEVKVIILNSLSMKKTLQASVDHY